MTDPASGGYQGPPSWVKKSAIIALVLVLFFVSHLYFGGGISAMHHAVTP